MYLNVCVSVCVHLYMVSVRVGVRVSVSVKVIYICMYTHTIMWIQQPFALGLGLWNGSEWWLGVSWEVVTHQSD